MRSCRFKVQPSFFEEEGRAKQTPSQARRCNQLAQCSGNFRHLLRASSDQQRLPRLQAVVSSNRSLLAEGCGHAAAASRQPCQHVQAGVRGALRGSKGVARSAVPWQYMCLRRYDCNTLRLCRVRLLLHMHEGPGSGCLHQANVQPSCWATSSTPARSSGAAPQHT